MKKKKSLIGICLLLLVTVIGVTFAYYTSNTSFVNLFNTGKYKVKVVEEFVSPDNWVPGETIPKTVTAKNEGNVDAAVRISYVEKWETQEGVDITDQIDSNPAIINFSNTSDWTLNSGYYYYNYILKPNDVSNSFISGVTLDPALNGVTCTGEGNERVCEAQNSIGGAKYKLTFTIETAQADKYKEIWNTEVEIIEKTLVVLPTGRTKDNLQVGDEICIDGTTTECFYFIGYDDDNIKMLSKYNLNVGNNIQSGVEGVQNNLAIGYNNDLSTQDVEHHFPATVAFSTNTYWVDSVNNSLKLNYGSSYPADVYDNDYLDASGDNYSIAYYVEQYKDVLESYGLSVEEARLLTYDEAISPSLGCDASTAYCSNEIIKNTSFWLGTAGNDNVSVWGVIALDVEGNFDDGYSYINYIMGVRPVIVISKSDV